MDSKKNSVTFSKEGTFCIHDTIPMQGFYVDKSGIIYYDGEHLLDESKFDAHPKRRNEYAGKYPQDEQSKADAVLMAKKVNVALVEKFMPAARGLAQVWDDIYQEGRMSAKKTNSSPGHINLIPNKDCAVKIKSKDGEEILEINLDKTISILGETFELEKLKDCLVNNLKSDNVGALLVHDTGGLKSTGVDMSQANIICLESPSFEFDPNFIQQLTDKIAEQQQSQITLLEIQVDSLQSQINVANAVKIEEAFEDEKFDSFKNRAKETLKEAYAVIEDMEGLDMLHQAKAIKEALLAENRRQLVLTHEKVRGRLERLQAVKETEETRSGWPIKRIIFAVVLIVLAAIYGPVILALIF